MSIVGFCHYTMICRDLDASCAFYREVLRMEVQPRDLPPGFPRAAIGHFTDGSWCVHFFQATPDQSRAFAALSETKTGTVKHVALKATGYAEAIERLRAHGATTREFTVGDRHLVQFLDPDGLELELVFPPAELPDGPIPWTPA